MKPNISLEFLRGLLFSYVAYQRYILFSGLAYAHQRFLKYRSQAENADGLQTK